MKRWECIYYTESEDDDGYRVVEAPDLQTSKDVLRRQIEAEGCHGAFRLHAIQEVVRLTAAPRPDTTPVTSVS